MLPFGKKGKLCRDVEKLAIYNDKGIAWAGHSESQVAEHRAALMARIRRAVDELGRGSLPTEFVSALDGSVLEQDGTGRFHETLRNHLRK
jgi:hypothetical protein